MNYEVKPEVIIHTYISQYEFFMTTGNINITVYTGQLQLIEKYITLLVFDLSMIK